MGISPDEMNVLIESQEEERDRAQVKKIKLATGERRERDRRKSGRTSRDFLGMEKRVDPDRRTNIGKGRIQHNQEYKSL
jgi:hypothetical protein